MQIVSMEILYDSVRWEQVDTIDYLGTLPSVNSNPSIGGEGLRLNNGFRVAVSPRKGFYIVHSIPAISAAFLSVDFLAASFLAHS